MKIQIYLVELVFISSLPYIKTAKRREYVKQFSHVLGDCWMELLDWKSINATEVLEISKLNFGHNQLV